jgi:hypothetical protein
MTGTSLFFFVAALICMAGVLVSLLLGITAMTKTEMKDRQTSLKMMRWRVTLQGAALLMLAISYAAR